MSHPIPVERAPRFAAFDDGERAVIQYALIALADNTLADAEREEIDREALASAGAAFLLASTLAHELDPSGDHPPREAVELLASCIAEGEAPLAAKMAREAVAE